MKNRAFTIGDNYKFELLADSRGQFELGMHLAFNNRGAHAYAISPHFGMIFLWYVGSDEKSEKHTHELDRQFLLHEDKGSVVDWTYKPKYIYIEETYPIVAKAINLPNAIEMAWKFLEKAKYESEPDHDGSNSKGYLISTGDLWGHVGCHHGSICHVRPEWIMLGK